MTLSPIYMISAIIAAYLLVRTVYISLFTPRLKRSRTSRCTSVDILVPVRNEVDRGLEANLKTLINQTHPHGCLIFTDDQSTDGSTQVIDDLSRMYSDRVVAVHGKAGPPGWMGKTYALAQAKSFSTARWMALVDADVSAEPDLVSSALDYATRRRLDAVCVLPAFTYRSFWTGIVLPIMVWWSAIRVSPIETNRQTSKEAFALGNFILVRRSAHDAIGGFEAYKSSVLDDCELMQRLKDRGHSVAVVDGATLLSSPMYDTIQELVAGFAKNAFAAMGRRWFLLIGLLVFEALFLLVLPVSFAQGHLVAGVALLLFAGAMIVAGFHLKAKVHYYLLFPLGHVISTGIILFSAIRTGPAGGVSWKGRTVQ